MKWSGGTYSVFSTHIISFNNDVLLTIELFSVSHLFNVLLINNFDKLTEDKIMITRRLR